MTELFVQLSSAIATLVTGVLAVGAAWYVGRNQLEIQRRQTEIQLRQIALSENDLKIQLLDKRSACVNAMREIHFAWNRDRHLSDEDWKKFYSLSQDAVLLYPTNLARKLDSAANAVFWAKHHYGRYQFHNDRGNQGQADEKRKQAYAEEDKAMIIMPKLLDELIEYTRVSAWE